jgi:protein-S-isoprenylcysteine O-methyltransferase Ste14
LIFSIPFTVAFVGAILFLPVGDFYWQNGWMFIASLVFYLLVVFIYFIIKDPETLEKRSKLSQEKGDALYLTVVGVIFLAAMALPVLDQRFGWTNMAMWISWIGFGLLILSYFILFLVMRENSYASKGLRIHEGQKIIDTGLYALVRHPMYIAAILMSIGIPLTLGSWLGVLPALFTPLVFGLRIGKEEKMLLRELEGYEAYRQKVKYRLIPGLW